MQQADSITYPIQQGQSADSVKVYRTPVTPYQAIRMLPHNATPAQQDSVVQLYCKLKIFLPASTRPDTLGIPGLKADKVPETPIPFYKEGFFSQNENLHPELKVDFPGIPGDPVPYTLRTDIFITSALLISLFLFSFIAAKSLHVFLLQIKDLLHKKSRKETVMLNMDYELKSHVHIHILNSLLAGTLFFNYSKDFLPTIFNQSSPYKLILLDIGFIFCFYIIKGVAYKIVNWTFFPRQEREQWNNTHCLLSIIKTLFLFPLTLVVVYYSLPATAFLWIVGIIFTIYEGLILLKSKQYFFSYKFGLIHLFLYFCTLEIMTLALGIRALVYINEYYI